MPLDPSNSDFFSENKIFNKLLSSENYDLIRKYILNQAVMDHVHSNR